MKEKMKQNKKYVAIFCVVIMLVSIVSISSFAYTDNSTNGIDFTDQPCPILSDGSSSNVKANGYKYYQNGSNVMYFASNSSDIYIFASSQDGTFYIVSESSPLKGWSANGNDSVWTINSTNPTYNSTYNLYWGSLGLPYAFNSSYSLAPVFDTFINGLSAVRDWLDNPPVVSTPHNLVTDLPAGNAIFIEYMNSSTGSISTYFNQAHGSPFSTSNQTMAYVDSIPSSFTSIGSPINWVGNGKTDLLGRYRNFSLNLIPNPNHRYLVIVNPYFNSSYVDVEHEDSNYEIHINMTDVISAQFVALNSSVVSGSVENSSSDNKYTLEYDDSTGQWVSRDSDGNIAYPTPGGNIIPVTGNTINDWLQNISNQISGFFKGAIGAVSTLVDAGSAFFNVLTGLYSWLPPAVFSVLSSALIVIITIGVIKVFI